MTRLLPIALLIACSDYKVHTIDDGNTGADAPGEDAPSDPEGGRGRPGP